MNAQIGKNENKFFFHDLPNRNGKHLPDFSPENSFSCQNTKFQKRKGKLWNFTNPNNAKEQLDYIFIKKKEVDKWIFEL